MRMYQFFSNINDSLVNIDVETSNAAPLIKNIDVFKIKMSRFKTSMFFIIIKISDSIRNTQLSYLSHSLL